MARSEELNATLEKRIEVTPELVRLFVRPDTPLGVFQSGQYVALGLPGSAVRDSRYPPEEVAQVPEKLIKRAYSIGSSPSDPSLLEFYIALLPQGALTARLSALREGDRLFMAPKVTGTFTLEGVPPEASLVLVSTGTGLAPFMSMVRTPETWSVGRAITIIHGVRYPSDLAYRDELEQFGTRDNFRYLAIASRAGPEWSGPRGHVQQLFAHDGPVQLDPRRDHVFLCGNPAMIDDVEKLLLERGFTVHSKKNPGNLHLEKYW